VKGALARRSLLHDKAAKVTTNVVSAFIKRCAAATGCGVVWMMRMLEERAKTPLFVLRRMIIFASEDIGNADPRALELAVAADHAFQRLGMPEGMHPLGQCCVYLACAPKSNASYAAWSAARADVKEHGALPVPKKLRNASTRAMKDWGYGAGYRYPHDEGGYAEGETYLPESLVGRKYYQPSENGLEARNQTTPAGAERGRAYSRRSAGQRAQEVVHSKYSTAASPCSAINASMCESKVSRRSNTSASWRLVKSRPALPSGSRASSRS